MLSRHCLALVVLLSSPLGVVRAADPVETKSALESDPTGWKDLMKDKELKDWKRVAIPPGSKLNPKNPWSAEKDLLVCAGKGAGHEMLLFNEEFGDGVFHVEWRFKEVENGKGYNSGVYVRNSADGAVWHQAQVGNKNIGYIFGETLVDGQKKRINIKDASVPQRGKGAGEWNVFEITCKGKDVALWVNGAVTARWTDCQVPKGHVGMEAEGWDIEFRYLKFRGFEKKPEGM